MEVTTSRSHMCTAANVYINTTYKPAFCPFLLCTRNLGQIQQRARCANDNPFDDGFYNNFQCKTLGHKTMRFSQGHFMGIFLKKTFYNVSFNHKHMTAKGQDVKSIAILDIFVHLSLSNTLYRNLVS